LSFVSILPSVKKNAKLLDTRPEQAGIDDFEPASIFIVGSDAHAGLYKESNLMVCNRLGSRDQQVAYALSWCPLGPAELFS